MCLGTSQASIIRQLRIFLQLAIKAFLGALNFVCFLTCVLGLSLVRHPLIHSSLSSLSVYTFLRWSNNILFQIYAVRGISWMGFLILFFVIKMKQSRQSLSPCIRLTCLIPLSSQVSGKINPIYFRCVSFTNLLNGAKFGAGQDVRRITV